MEGQFGIYPYLTRRWEKRAVVMFGSSISVFMFFRVFFYISIVSRAEYKDIEKVWYVLVDCGITLVAVVEG